MRRILLLATCLLMFALTACGGKAPASTVEQALSYHLASAPAVHRKLVGFDKLQQRSQISDVKVRKDRAVTIPLRSGSKLSARELSGTYTLAVQLPGERRPYRRRNEPFRLTLAEAEGTWLLVYPGSEPETVAFLPPQSD